MTQPMLSPIEAVAHLQPNVWALVTRRLIAKALCELAHELLIEPELLRAEGPSGEYSLTPGPHIEYQFRARVLQLDHWQIEPASIRKLEHGRPVPLDALRLIIELRAQLAIPEAVLPEYLEELASTLSAAAYKQLRRAPAAAELARADFQQIESSMTEGHPSFIANNGRLGWSAIDYSRYAPELGQPLQLVWLAAHERRAELALVHDWSYPQLLQQELGPAALEAFARLLRGRGFDPERYRLLPVHPWQWDNKLAQLFASDLACGDLVYLGCGDDRYLAQQSIRTFFNISRPDKLYVKTALSIVNMGFSRGIPSTIAQRAASVNDWVQNLVAGDAYLRRLSFRLLREVAFIGYRHRYYEAAIARRSDVYKEMLGAMWRESPSKLLGPRQRLMTMAALMHVDAHGNALWPALIEASGLSIDGWLTRYLNAYLKPLLHCFYTHHLVFTPHCENTILVLEDDAPVGVIMKDLAEDIGVLNPEAPLPPPLERLGLTVPEDVMTLAIFTDVFDCVFRYLAPLLQQHAQYPEERFWRAVAGCVLEYQREQPQLCAKFARYDMFAPSFARNCLNRLQLRNTHMMVDLNAPEPVDSLQLIGSLQNPIAAYGGKTTTGAP